MIRQKAKGKYQKANGSDLPEFSRSDTSICLLIFAFCLFLISAPAQQGSHAQSQFLNKQIAARFAPIVYQGLGDDPRSDYITNFDFDGDWKGDNNWDNLDNRSFPLRAYVYYSVVETNTHYFIHYAFFHPRDYKGGLT